MPWIKIYDVREKVATGREFLPTDELTLLGLPPLLLASINCSLRGEGYNRSANSNTN